MGSTSHTCTRSSNGNEIIEKTGGIRGGTETANATVIEYDDAKQHKYDAEAIREEFKIYQSVLPKPDELLQQQHSFQLIRTIIEEHQLPIPRFLKYNFEKDEGGNSANVKPHHALCCLLLTEYQQSMMEDKVDCSEDDDVDVNEEDGLDKKNMKKKNNGVQQHKRNNKSSYGSNYWFTRIISLGYLYPQHNNPAEFIRDQFNRVAEVIPLEVATTKPHELRKKIRNASRPIPNYFLDPESEKQFPPHIALLVILQDGQQEHDQIFTSLLYRIAFSLFAVLALLLRIVLEVVGGAGAIWGGGEVLTLRHSENAEVWRWLSIAVGVLCLLRFITLNLPQKEDDGDILGPAGPWSLRTGIRMRAVCEHPFHYFFRAVPPPPPPFVGHQHQHQRRKNE